MMFSWLRRRWHESDTDRRVRKHGWTAIYVGDYQTAPTWAYTVGLDESLDQPELIVFDAPQESVNALFWGAYEALKDGSLVLEDGLNWSEDHEHPCVWREVHPSQINCDDGWFTFAVIRRARRTHQMEGLRAFQFVLSDNDGKLPWEEGYDERLRERQPPLWLPVAEENPSLAAEAGL